MNSFFSNWVLCQFSFSQNSGPVLQRDKVDNCWLAWNSGTLYDDGDGDDNNGKGIHSSHYMSSSFLSTLCMLTSLVIVTTQWSKHYYYPHFIHVKTEAQSYLPKLTQIICGWARIQTRQSGSRIHTLDHCIILPLRWDTCSVPWNSTIIHSFL